MHWRVWILVAAGAVGLWALGGEPSDKSPDIEGQSIGATTGYVVENGQIAWRPMGGLDKFIFNILTLGQAANSPTVNGRTLHLADPDTFRVVAGRYGLDQSRVWLEGAEISGADPATFAVLGRGFSHDAAQLWKGGTLVLSLPEGDAPVIEVHSDHIVSVDDTTWLTGTASVQLPERPLAEPVHFCRHWFEMNDTIWLGADQRMSFAPDTPVEQIACDASVFRRYTNDVPIEDVSENDGLLIAIGASVWRFLLSGEDKEVFRLDEPINGFRLMTGNYQTDDFLLVQGQSQTVYAASLGDHAIVQPLGQFSSLPDRNDFSLGDAFWLDETYFTNVPTDAITDKVVTALGQAERLGNYARVGDFIYHGARLLAVPGDLPVRVVAGDFMLIGKACISYGSYVTDVADPAVEDSTISSECDVHRRPDGILYDDLQIQFAPLINDRGPSAENPELNALDIGTLSVTNVSDEPRQLPVSFFEGFELRINNTVITPPDDAWPADGVTLSAGDSLSWTLDVVSDADPRYWGWTLKMRHVTERAKVFGDEPFYIANGQFFGGN